MGLAFTSLVTVMATSVWWSGQPYLGAGLLVGLVALPVYFSALLRRLNHANRELEAMSRDLAELAQQDPLTGLPNRRRFQEHLQAALAHVRRHHTGLALLFLDLDGFKQVNDEFGQALGNVMLRKLGAAIVDSVRPGDIVGRLGGDEFLLLIPNVDPDHLGHIMDRVKDRVQSLAVRTRVGSVKVTVSIGGTLGSAGDRPEDLLRQADEAMRDGKRRRRNEGASAPTGDDDGHQCDASPNPDH